MDCGGEDCGLNRECAAKETSCKETIAETVPEQKAAERPSG